MTAVFSSSGAAWVSCRVRGEGSATRWAYSARLGPLVLWGVGESGLGMTHVFTLPGETGVMAEWGGQAVVPGWGWTWENPRYAGAGCRLAPLRFVRPRPHAGLAARGLVRAGRLEHPPDKVTRSRPRCDFCGRGGRWEGRGAQNI